MSRAFVSEERVEAAPAVLPERPVSGRPNLVTPRGLRLIEQQVAELQAAVASTADDAEHARLARDLRYWQSRRANAQLVAAPAGELREVAFGTTVSVRRPDGTVRRYSIVGEDEAEPANGLLSWSAPLAQALLGAAVGDLVEPGGGRPPVTVVAIERS